MHQSSDLWVSPHGLTSTPAKEIRPHGLFMGGTRSVEALDGFDIEASHFVLGLDLWNVSVHTYESLTLACWNVSGSPGSKNYCGHPPGRAQTPNRGFSKPRVVKRGFA